MIGAQFYMAKKNFPMVKNWDQNPGEVEAGIVKEERYLGIAA